MTIRTRLFTPVAAAAITLCALTSPAHAIFGLFEDDDNDAVPAPAEMQRREALAKEVFEKARTEEQKGDFDDAADLYREVVDDYPLTSLTANSAIRGAQLYEGEGDPEDAFDTYQKFIELSRRDRRFNEVLSAQYQLAQRAKTGDFKRRLVGIKLDLPLKKKVEMFDTIASNAPRSPFASASLFAIGEIHQAAGDIASAIPAYTRVVADHPDSKEAPVAQYRIGQLYIAQSNQGAKDTTTMTSAREAFEDVLVLYPNHPLAKDARQQLGTVDSKQAAELLKIGKFYEKTEKPRAAAIYYRDVIKQGGPQDVVDEAKARLATLQSVNGESIAAPVAAAAPVGDDTPVDRALTKNRSDYVGPPPPKLAKRSFTPRSSAPLPPPPAEPLPNDTDGNNQPAANPLLPETGDVVVPESDPEIDAIIEAAEEAAKKAKTDGGSKAREAAEAIEGGESSLKESIQEKDAEIEEAIKEASDPAE